MTQITIHRALNLIKTSTQDLEDKIRNGIFISSVAGDAKVPSDKSFRTFSDLEKRIQSDTDSVDAKLKLIVLLKTAIQKKNLETFVTFSNKQVSITELLAIKSTLEQRSAYLVKLNAQTNRAQLVAETADTSIMQQLEKVEANSREAVLKSLNSLQKVSIVSANSNKSVAERIAELREEINFITNEIDILLSETNISTLIEVDM